MPGKSHPLGITLFLWIVSIALPGCRASEKKTKEHPDFDALVKQKLGQQYVVSYNTSKTHALCQQAREGDQLLRNFKYMVVKLQENKIVFEGSFRMGHALWIDDRLIEILSASVNGDETSAEKKIINIDSGQR
jgi:hypothetical protein